MKRAILLALLVASGAFAGCFKKDEPVDAAATDDTLVSEEAIEVAQQLAAPRPVRYTFPSQAKLPPLTTFINGTLGSEAVQGIENPQDRGGISYNTMVIAQDISNLLPVGQPALLEMQLWYDNGPGRSADLDIYVDVPGTHTHVDRSYSDEVTWTLPVKTLAVSTVGVSGETHELGIQVANGRIAPGQTLQYWMRVTVRYALDGAAPGVPYGLHVPEEASGLIVEALKFETDKHLQGKFVVIGPNDDLVASVDFNDLSIPTESVFIPVTQPGEHVLYISEAHGGFFNVRADVPLEKEEARILQTSWTEIGLFDAPAAPGTAQTWIDDTSTPYSEGARADFSIDGAFPLEVRPALRGDTVVTGDVEVRLSSSKGLVALLHRTARLDDARGSVGFTDENNDFNRQFHPEMLAKGAWSASAVINGHSGRIVADVLTYVR